MEKSMAEEGCSPPYSQEAESRQEGTRARYSPQGHNPSDLVLPVRAH